MSLTEFIFVALFIAVALFTVVEAIRIPIVVKRWYQDNNFNDRGKQQLDDISGSVLVEGMYTDSLYSGVVGGSSVNQCKAWSNQRRQFTLSKAKRNRNKTAWSVTIVDTEVPHARFLALPSIVPEAVSYMGDGRNIEFPGDDQLSSRYHVTTEEPDLIRTALSGEVRQFLLESEVIFIEQTGKNLVLKRKWSPEKPTDRILQEIDFAVNLHGQFAAENSKA